MTLTVALKQAPIEHLADLFIGGEWVKPRAGGLIDVINPANERVYAQVGEALHDDIDRAVASAREAFDHGPWPRMSHRERAAYIRALGSGLSARAEDAAQIWPSEMGSTYQIARAFSETIGEVYEYYAGLAETFVFEERHDNPPGGGRVALLVREPVGVVGAIIPWNAPLNLMAYKMAPALLAGCTVVLKVSPEAPVMGYLMAEIAESINLPPGVLNVVTADRGPSEQLVRHPGVDKISFTGSLAAGKQIGKILMDRMARSTLELGGKSAGVVMDDFDLAAAASAIAGDSCLLSGQVCSALSRIIVPQHRHDELLDALGSSFGAITVGDPFDSNTGMGPVATARQRDVVERYVKIAVGEGATLAQGGSRPAGLDSGFYVRPTVLGHVDNDSTVAREEIFGPVISVIPARDEEHAIELANDTIFGLNNTVFTNDPDRAYAVARRLRSGTVGQNVFRSDMRIGFGGFKQSGIGREGGPDGLRPYLENKTIIMDELPAHVARAGQ